MSPAWIAVLGVGAATIALKGAGPLVFADRELPVWVRSIMPLLAPCLLAALVVGQALADGRALAARRARGGCRGRGCRARAARAAARGPRAAAGVAAATRALGLLA